MSEKEKTGRKKNSAYLKWTAFFGILFLVNPNISVLDPLPDFVGWLLLVEGIKRIVRLELAASDVVPRARKLAVLSLIRLICTPIVIYIAAGDRSFYMLATFVFNIIEPIMAIGFFYSLFDGVAVVGYQSNAKSPVRYLSQMKLITVLFFIYKSVLNALPDLTYFKMSDLLDYELYPLERYRFPLTIICVSLCLFAGVIWYIAFCGYLRRLRKEPELSDELEKREIEQNKTGKEADDSILRKVFLLLLVGMAFLCDLPIDGYNVLPDIVGVIFIVLAAKRLGELSEVPQVLGAVKIAALVHGVSSTVSLVLNGIFAHRYYQQSGEEMLPILAGKIAVNTLFAAVSFASCLVLLFLIFKMFKELIDKNTSALISSGTQGLHKSFRKSVATALLLILLSEFFGVLSIALIFRVGWLTFAAVLCGAIGVYRFYSFYGEFMIGFGNKNPDSREKKTETE